MDFPSNRYSFSQPKTIFGCLLTKTFAKNADVDISSKLLLPLLLSSASFFSALSPHVLIDCRVPRNLFHFLCQNSPTIQFAHTLRLEYEDDRSFEDEIDDEDEYPQQQQNQDLSFLALSENISKLPSLRCLIFEYIGYDGDQQATIFTLDLMTTFAKMRENNNNRLGNQIESLRLNNISLNVVSEPDFLFEEIEDEENFSHLPPFTRLRDLQLQNLFSQGTGGVRISDILNLIRVNGRTLQFLNLNGNVDSFERDHSDNKNENGIASLFNCLAESCPVLVSLGLDNFSLEEVIINKQNVEKEEIEKIKNAILAFAESPCVVDTLRDLELGSYSSTSIFDDAEKTTPMLSSIREALFDLLSGARLRTLKTGIPLNSLWIESFAKNSSFCLEHLEIVTISLDDESNNNSNNNDISEKQNNDPIIQSTRKSFCNIAIPIGFKNIKILSLDSNPVVNDDVLVALSKTCTCLEEFSMLKNKHATEKGMITFLTQGLFKHSLVSLTLCGSSQSVLTPPVFTAIAENYHNLVTLNVAGSSSSSLSGLDDDSFIKLLSGCPYWSYVMIQNSKVTSKGIFALAQDEDGDGGINRNRLVRGLSCYGCSEIGEDSLLAFAKSKSLHEHGWVQVSRNKNDDGWCDGFAIEMDRLCGTFVQI